MKYFLQIFFLLFFLQTIRTEETIPSFSSVKDSLKLSESQLLDRKGRVIQELRTYPKERRLEWVSHEDLSPFLLESVRLAEDRRFYEHSGVDWKALGAGIIKTFTPGPARGASTITMQLAGILTESFKTRKRNLFQKWNQIRAAQEIERTWSKEEILETYLNLVGYRGEMVGITAAAQGLFQKSPHGLNKKESLLLAAMIKNPSFKKQRLIQRACYLQSIQYEVADCKELKEWANRILEKGYRIYPPQNLAPHLANKLLKQGEKEHQIKTTLDIDIQKKALEFCQNRLLELKSQNVHDCAILIVENKTGSVLAYIGGSGKLSKNSEIDGVFSNRQAGSTLKPFVYGLAFEKRLITPGSILEDRPISIQVGTGIYNPGNYEGHFYGNVSARIALASSLNAPAVRVLDLVGVEEMVDLLESLGFKNLRNADFYGLSLALGSLDVRLWDLVSAYTVLANNGKKIPIHFIDGMDQPIKQVISEEASFLVSHILKDREARSLSFGIDNPLATRIPASVKTGTSKDMRDNWCIGYTNEFTVGVWVGNHSGEPMWNVSGITGAATIWSELIHHLHKGLKYTEESPPSGVVSRTVFNESDGTTNTEWFYKGTETENIRLQKPDAINKIKKPIRDTIIAIDPDIPRLAQSLTMEAESHSKDLFWVINGKQIGNADSPLFWPLLAGDHTLELKTKSGKIVDSVKFQVK
jgi:penicillin-binding protein 1C